MSTNNTKKNSVVLFLDTTDNKKTIIKLHVHEVEYEKSLDHYKPEADATLILINKILEENSIKPEQIDHIYVKRGPGSFTGVRLGVSIANAISFALGILVNTISLGDIEQPEYIK